MSCASLVCLSPKTVATPSDKPNSNSATLSSAPAPRLSKFPWRKKNGYHGSGLTCPHCQRCADFKGYRPKTAESLLGTIHYRRAYYHCGRCALGLFPFDDEVGLSSHRLTPGAERVVSLLGLTCNSFEEAAEKVLPEASGLRLSEATVRLVTEDAGKRLGTLHEEGHTLGDSKPFAWHKDAEGKTCAYISLDLTGVPQQAKGGGTAEGRMPYVAAIYNPVPEKPAIAKGEPLPTPGYEPVAETVADAEALPRPSGPRPLKRPRMQARYVAGLWSLAALGLVLRKQAAQVGMEQAERWIALGDAGSGLENFERTNFNRADLVVILDFWHPTGYLENLARCWYGDDEEARTRQAEAWCHQLKHEGGQALLETLKGLELPKNKAVGAAHAEAVGYIENNVHRMDYPYYLSQGWQIGSGPIESACKTVVGQRLKLAGMRWREYGTDNICHLRALFKSDKDQWDAFWERNVN
jgi:hypothetical protein